MTYTFGNVGWFCVFSEMQQSLQPQFYWLKRTGRIALCVSSVSGISEDCVVR